MLMISVAFLAACIVEMTMTVWTPSLEREGLFKALTARLAEIAD